MNDNHSQNGSAKLSGELLAIQLTAYALGELEGPEQAELEQLLADPAQAEARRIVAETRRLATALPEAAANGSARSPQLREAVLQHLAAQPEESTLVEPARRPAAWRRWSWLELAVAGAAACLVVVLFWPAGQYSHSVAQKTSEPRKVTSHFAKLRILRAPTNQPMATGEGENIKGLVVITDGTVNAPLPAPDATTARTVTTGPVATELSPVGKAETKYNLLATLDEAPGKGLVVPSDPKREKSTAPLAESTSTVAGTGAVPPATQPNQSEFYYKHPLNLRDGGLTAQASKRTAEEAARFGERQTATLELARINNELTLREEKELEKRRGDRGWYEGYGTEQYAKIIENLFLSPTDQPLSTFSIDVDTASYANVRRFLTSGRLPPPDAVRIEELVNYFTYSYPQPKGADPFSVNMEVAQSPWREGALLLRVGLKGKEIHRGERPMSNLVFLIDVSGSMADENKLPLVKTALSLFVSELTENDRVSIVTYAGDAGLRLPPTSGDQQRKILAEVESLQAGGSTHGSAGIQLAYEQAGQYFIKGGTNRVILATDGDLNVGITSDEALVELIKGKAAGGTFLTVLGFGEGNLKDAKMEGLADNGNGLYAYIDSVREARKVLVEQMAGSTITIAKDVKIQIEFNPAQVAQYRLLGYENRVLAAQDFNNDKKDAGEIGAGHTVTALYEIIPVGAAAKAAEGKAGVDPLKYQATGSRSQVTEERTQGTGKLTDAAASGELLTLKLRYKQPDGDTSKLLEYPLKDRGSSFNAASKDMQFAAAVASFGMVLRGSEFRGTGNLAAVAEIASGSLGDDPGGYRAEFVDLVRKAQGLGVK